MGVKGLWRLLLPIGRRISIETLEGKILAIDASIWLTQFLKAMRDPDTGSVKPDAHLIGFFRRLCKLRYMGIRPVLVFDGATPEIKKRETRQRRQRREQLAISNDANAVQRMAKRILMEELKKKKKEEQQLKKVLASPTKGNQKTNSNKKPNRTSGAFAAGFNAGGDDDDEEEEEEENIKDKKLKSETNEKDPKVSNPTSIITLQDDSDDEIIISSTRNPETDNDAAIAKQLQMEEDERMQHEASVGPSDDFLVENKDEEAAAATISMIGRRVAEDTNSKDHEGGGFVVDESNDSPITTGTKSKSGSLGNSAVEVLSDTDEEEDEKPSSILQGKRKKLGRVKKLNMEEYESSNEDGIDTNNGKSKSGEGEVSSKATGNDFFNMDYVVSLPSHERKDAIEEAKRNQRMQSRREFMSVAAEPDAYSQTQLSNFLKSAKLSKKIHQMGKRAAAAAAASSDGGNSQNLIGEKIASDATRRVVFTKDKVSKSKDSFSRLIHNASPSSEKIRERQQNFIMPKRKKQWYEDGYDEDGEFDWTAEEAENNYDTCMDRSIQKTRVQINTSSSPQKDASILVMRDDCTSDEDSGGGFLSVTNGEQNVGNGNEDFGGDGFLPSAEGFIENQLPPDDGGGGFLTATEDSTLNQLPKEKGCSGGGSLLPFSNAQRNDVLVDDEEGGGFVPGQENTTIQSVEKVDLSKEHGDHMNDQVAVVAMVNNRSPNSAYNIDLQSDGDKKVKRVASDDDSDESVDWEDGDEEKKIESVEGSHGDDENVQKTMIERGGEKEEKSKEPNPTEIITLQDDSEDEIVVSSRRRPQTENDAAVARQLQEEENENISLLSVKNMRSDAHGTQIDLSKDDDSDADIDWEDGNDDIKQNYSNPEILKARTTTPKSDLNDGALRSTSPEKHEEAFDEASGLPAALDDQVGNNFVQCATSNSKTAEALEHAQATAAKLTDWAGRAFRRALAKHAEETGRELSINKNPSKEEEHPNKEKEEVPNDSNFVAPNRITENRASATVGSRETFPKNEQHASNRRPGNSESVPSREKSFSYVLPEADLYQAQIDSLQEQEDLLVQEKRRLERDMDTVTDEMKEEVIQLVRLFGIPYVESPAEAESQCAMLEELGLVDGIVTEDSDIFVFGGQKIYRHIFDDQKYVEAYLTRDAEKELALGRNQFVALAMLLGGDYTDGVKGVGIVNGMEILQAFDVSKSVKDGLAKFRKWLDGFDPADAIGSAPIDISSAEQKFHAKHRTARTRWIAPKNFPADNVMAAYLSPVVDKSEERFSWGVPDLRNLVTFCRKNMGWEASETERLMKPVIEKVESRSHQTRLESFFMSYEDNIKFANVKSKRLREVFSGIQGSSKNMKPIVGGTKLDRSNSNNQESPSQTRRKRTKRIKEGAKK